MRRISMVVVAAGCVLGSTGVVGASAAVEVEPAQAVPPVTVAVTASSPECDEEMAAVLFQGGSAVSPAVLVEGAGPLLALAVPATVAPGDYQIVVFCRDPDGVDLVAFAEVPFQVLAAEDPLDPSPEALVPAPAHVVPTFTG